MALATYRIFTVREGLPGLTARINSSTSSHFNPVALLALLTDENFYNLLLYHNNIFMSQLLLSSIFIYKVLFIKINNTLSKVFIKILG
jgi:hypothetical protein